MANRMVIELSDGNKVLFGGAGQAIGLNEVGLGGDIAKATGDKFKAALGSLASLVSVLEESVGRMPRRPDKIEMEFSASLTADCDLWIVSGEGEAEFKVTLGWDKA
jgi:hypothetical protein